MVAVDLFSHAAKDYLCMTDRYSGNCWVHMLRSTTTAAITNQLTNWFLELGIPTRLRSDKGPQFRKDFNDYCADLNIDKETSSTYYPQSNGL